MQPQCADACRNLALPRPLLGFRHRTHFSPPPASSSLYEFPRISCSFTGDSRRRPHGGRQKGGGEGVRAKEKDNVWSIDNDLASRASSEERSTTRRRRRGRRRVKGAGRRGRDSRVLVSAAMLIEIETVLQTQTNLFPLPTAHRVPHLRMQPQCSDACRNVVLPRPLLGFLHRTHFSPPSATSSLYEFPRISFSFIGDGRRRPHGGRQKGGWEGVRIKEKDNVWSIDNELASRASSEESTARRRRVKGAGRRRRNLRVLVSTAMLIETETVLQTHEPVIKPAWDTFSSSLSGIWKGVGAVFSPSTAEMEPVGVGNQNENLYDCYTLSCIEKVPFENPCCLIRRKTNWVTLNPFGETRNHVRGRYRDSDRDKSSVPEKEAFDVIDMNLSLPTYESFDFGSSEVLEEDSMSMEPGLIFFEDGSYSRGPVNIPVGEFHESKYFLSPVFKFEQCLVKGCHKRLRIVHTIEFNEGGSSIQITRVAVYEEQWVSPVNLYDENDVPSDLKPLSQRRRTQPSELTGSWKVFEVSATPVFSEETEEGGEAYVHLCTEALKKRSLAESSTYFGEEEMADMRDATILWLPGGVTGYVDVRDDGVLCIGFGWYSDEGVNLVMERDYGMDGNLKEVRWKTEVKRRWGESLCP